MQTNLLKKKYCKAHKDPAWAYNGGNQCPWRGNSLVELYTGWAGNCVGEAFIHHLCPVGF